MLVLSLFGTLKVTAHLRPKQSALCTVTISWRWWWWYYCCWVVSLVCLNLDCSAIGPKCLLFMFAFCTVAYLPTITHSKDLYQTSHHLKLTLRTFWHHNQFRFCRHKHPSVKNWPEQTMIPTPNSTSGMVLSPYIGSRSSPPSSLVSTANNPGTNAANASLAKPVCSIPRREQLQEFFKLVKDGKINEVNQALKSNQQYALSCDEKQVKNISAIHWEFKCEQDWCCRTTPSSMRHRWVTSKCQTSCWIADPP